MLICVFLFSILWLVLPRMFDLKCLKFGVIGFSNLGLGVWIFVCLLRVFIE